MAAPSVKHNLPPRFAAGAFFRTPHPAPVLRVPLRHAGLRQPGSGGAAAAPPLHWSFVRMTAKWE